MLKGWRAPKNVTWFGGSEKCSRVLKLRRIQEGFRIQANGRLGWVALLIEERTQFDTFENS